MTSTRLKTLTLLQHNSAGVLRQKHELTTLLQTEHIDCCCLSETFLKPNRPFNIPGYQAYREDRPSLTARGGVALVVKATLPHHQTSLPTLNSIEAVAVTLHTLPDALLLIAAYFPPKRKLDTTDFDKIRKINPHFLILGDLNSKYPTWNPHSPPNNAGHILHKYATEKNLTIHAPTQPTHPFPSQTIIDIGVAHNIKGSLDMQVVYALNSDHLPVKTTLTLTAKNKLTECHPKDTDYDWTIFQNHLTQQLPHHTPCTSPTDIDKAIDQITKTIQDGLEHARTRTRTRTYATPLPTDIRRLISYKNRMRKRYIRTHNPAYKTITNNLKKVIAQEISAHQAQRMTQQITDHPDDPYFMPRIFMSKPRNIPILKVTQGDCETDEDKAALLANLYQTQFTPNHIPDQIRETVERHPSMLGAERWTNLDDQPLYFPPSLVQKTLLTINPKKAPGLDNIPSFVLKHLPIKIIILLTNTFNACTRLSHYPTPWKVAKVVPVPEPNKPKNLPTSYRPISLLSCLAKTLDLLILNAMVEVADEKKIISDFQYGFRRYHSTTQQLFRVGEIITTNLNRGHCTGFVSLDLEKAFDKVWHPGLYYKLIVSGFSARIANLIRAYLSNRSFRVIIQGKSSPTTPILSGVPQGSALGPLLFILYTKDIPLPIDHRTNIALYADDTAILTTSKDIPTLHKLIQIQTTEITKYYDDWGLHTNPNKSCYTIFTSKRLVPTQTLNICDIPVTNTNELKYLGLILDRQLRFEKQVTTNISNAQARQHRLYPILKHAPPHTATLLYKSYIRLLLTYASPVWYPLITPTRQKKLQISQNKALRLSHNISRSSRTSINTLHNLSGIPLLQDFILKRIIPAFAKSLVTHTNPTLADAMTQKFTKHPSHPSLNYIYNPP